MSENAFFQKKIFNIDKLFSKKKFKKKEKIYSIKTLKKAGRNDLTFYDSRLYIEDATITKASFCITTSNLAKDLPVNVEKIIVKNVLFELAIVLKKFTHRLILTIQI